MNTSSIALFISQNGLWIVIIIIIFYIGYKLVEYWNQNKKQVLKKVSQIQDKYKLPKQP